MVPMATLSTTHRGTNRPATARKQPTVTHAATITGIRSALDKGRQPFSAASSSGSTVP
jgi:hypothetical protein